MYCYNCGDKVKSGIRFCPNCGAEQTNAKTQKAKQDGPEKIAAPKKFTEAEKAQAKERISKAEKSINNAGKSAAAFGWLFLFGVSGIVALYYSMGSWDKNALLLTLVLGFMGALIVIILGNYIEAVYRKNTRSALWLCFFLCIFGARGIIPLVVAIYCIGALFSLNKVRTTTYFRKKVEAEEPFRLSKRAFVFITAAALIAIGTFAVVAKSNKSIAISRDDYISGCFSAATETATDEQKTKYCSCVYDTGVQELGEAKYLRLEGTYDANSKTPTEVQSVVDKCNSQIQ